MMLRSQNSDKVSGYSCSLEFKLQFVVSGIRKLFWVETI
jgi:hypothetical protein